MTRPELLSSSGVLILAGRGSRMGLSADVQKCALTFGDRPLFSYVLEQFLRLPLQRVSLVVGSGADYAWSAHRRMIDALGASPAVPVGVHHDPLAVGSATSVRVAVCAADSAVLYGTPTAMVSSEAWAAVLGQHDATRVDATLLASADPEIAGHPPVAVDDDGSAVAIGPEALGHPGTVLRLVGGGMVSGRVLTAMTGSMSGWLGRHLEDHPGCIDILAVPRVMHFATPTDFAPERVGWLRDLTDEAIGLSADG